MKVFVNSKIIFLRILSMQIKLQRNKDVKTSAKTSQVSSLNSSMIRIKKEDSKHTKPSMHMNWQLAHEVGSVKKSKKQEKLELQKEQKKHKAMKSCELMTSGRSKQTKLKIKNKKSSDFQTFSRQKYDQIDQNGGISYRQYCLVQNSFVPVVSQIEHQKIEQIMQSTADNSQIYEDFNRTTFRNVFPFKLKDTNRKIESIGEVKRISENEDIIFVSKDKKIEKKEINVEEMPFYEEIGIQYSERPLLGVFHREQSFKPKQLKGVEIDIQTDLIPVSQTTSLVKNLEIFLQSQPKKQQSLCDLLTKLQFKHLPNEKAFQQMSKQQKEHYSQLLTSLISKLNYSPRQNNCSPKQHNGSPRQKQKQSLEQIKQKKMIQTEEVQLTEPLEDIKIQYAKLQREIMKRESSQMGWIQVRFEAKYPQDAFDTSILAVSSFLLNFFCYIELNYMEEFLENIQKQYGPSYFSQYLRVTRGLKIYNNYEPVLEQGLFDMFCQQLKQISPLQKHHLHCIFDHINQLLDTYRPSYHHKGEPFPWSLRMYKSICQYVIDESSMEVIFVETKENIQQTAASLCGLIVDEGLYKDIGELNPLSQKRSYKENLLIDMWSKEEIDETRLVECEVTKVFAQISCMLYEELILQIINEKPFKRVF